MTAADVVQVGSRARRRTLCNHDSLNIFSTSAPGDSCHQYSRLQSLTVVKADTTPLHHRLTDGMALALEPKTPIAAARILKEVGTTYSLSGSGQWKVDDPLAQPPIEQVQ